MKKTTHPEGLDEVQSLEPTPEIEDFVRDTAKDIESEQGERNSWEAEMDRLRDLRFGYKTIKNHPWDNAANHSIPLIDYHITQAKPDYINLLEGTTPICTFEPYGAEDMEPAGKRELLFDWRMRTKVKPFVEYCIGVDKALDRGSVVFKIVWNYTTRTYVDELDLSEISKEAIEAIKDPRVTDIALLQIIIQELSVDPDFEENIEEIEKAITKFREGETKFKFSFIEVKDNKPELTALDIKDDIFVPKDTTYLQEARFIDQPFWRTTNQIKIAMKDEKYKEYDDDAIVGWGSKKGGKKSVASSKNQDDVILLHETCVWYDVNDDGIKERCIVTWPDNTPTDVLRFIEIPYDHGMFPYVQVKRELIDKGFYASRGISALDEDFQIAISESINQAEDNGTIVNRPVIVMKRNTVTNIKNRRYIPGETVETTGSTKDYEIRQGANVSQPLLYQAAQYLKNWADGRVGNLSQGLSDINNLPGSGSGGKKTKAEIDLVSTLGGKVPTLDLQIWQQQMAGVFFQIDALYEQFGDDEEEILITNQEPQKIKRREIQGRFNVVPNGRLDNTNPILRSNKAFNLMKIFAGDPDINQYELKKIFLTDYDSRIGNKILYSQEDKQRIQQMQEETIAKLKEKAKAEGIEMAQMEALIEVWKEQMMTPITGRRFAPDGRAPLKKVEPLKKKEIPQ